MNQPAMPPEVVQMLPMKGHVFESKYRILDLSGAGGFARVYRARFEDVGRDVAVKILVPQSTDPARMYPEELVERFHREARAVSHLRSASTITLHDFGRTRSGLLYMIFEYVDGSSVNRLLKSGAQFTPHRVVHVMRQVLMSLREAHAVGILHRDIKPANIMLFDHLDHRDVVKVLDFGIAKQTHTADGSPVREDLTEAGAVMGTPRYMSPEQIVGQDLTPATDIYSLGLVAYEMLVGTPAAPDTEKSAIVRRHLGPEPIELPPVLAVPPGLRQIISTMLAKPLRDRYQSADEVLAALDAWEQTAADEQPTETTGFADIAPTEQSVTPPASTSGGWSTGAPAYTAPAPTASQSGWTHNPAPGFGPAAHAASPPPPGAAGWGNSTTGTGMGTGAIVPRPERTFIQVQATPDTFSVAVPMNPNKRGFLAMGLTGVFTLVAYIASGWLWIILLLPFAWAASLVFRTYTLTISTETGYEVMMSFFVYNRPVRGPMASIVRFEAIGNDEEDNTVLKLITHEGDHVVANAFSSAENGWVASEGNRWLQQVRARHPNPVG